VPDILDKRLDRYKLEPVETPAAWEHYHRIRRTQLWERRGLFGAYDEHHPDERAPGHHPLLLTWDGTPVGVMRIDVHDRTAVFRRVAIDADVQRRGHGRALLALAEAFAADHGCDRAYAFVAPDAVGFYRTCGFRHDPSPSVDSVHVPMEKHVGGGVQVRSRSTAADRRVRVRRYCDDDRAEWQRMRTALWPDQTVEDMNAWLGRTGAVVLVADRGGGRLTGFAEAATRPYADGCETSPVAYLEGWWVDPDARRQGVGRDLVDAVETWARGEGYSELASDTTLDNVGSQAAHRRLGFAEVERAVLFRKVLTVAAR
jgi:aminoglycoside 6'-N-acetyltransferase I